MPGRMFLMPPGRGEHDTDSRQQDKCQCPPHVAGLAATDAKHAHIWRYALAEQRAIGQSGAVTFTFKDEKDGRRRRIDFEESFDSATGSPHLVATYVEGEFSDEEMERARADASRSRGLHPNDPTASGSSESLDVTPECDAISAAMRSPRRTGSGNVYA